VTSTPLAPGGENPTEEACEGKGGTEFTVAGKETFACNGAKGKPGKAGEPGAIHPGTTLPPEASETGAWSFEGTSSSEGAHTLISISFPVPLAQALAKAGCKPELKNCAAHYVNTNGDEVVRNAESEWEEVKVEQCKGSVAAPTAEPGNLCVYETTSQGFREVEENLFETPLVLSPNFTKAAFENAEEGAGSTGAIIRPTANHPEKPLYAYGTWAVTAE